MGDYKHEWYQPCPMIALDAISMFWLTVMFITSLPLLLLLGPFLGVTIGSGGIVLKEADKRSRNLKGDGFNGMVARVGLWLGSFILWLILIYPPALVIGVVGGVLTLIIGLIPLWMVSVMYLVRMLFNHCKNNL